MEPLKTMEELAYKETKRLYVGANRRRHSSAEKARKLLERKVDSLLVQPLLKPGSFRPGPASGGKEREAFGPGLFYQPEYLWTVLWE